MPPEGGGERTEPATPRRKQEVRKRGQVARTAELGPALVLLGTYMVLAQIGPTFVRSGLLTIRQSSAAMSDAVPLDIPMVMGLLTPSVASMGQILAPIALAAAGTSLLAQVLQSGFLVSTEPLKPKWNRISPLEGLKRLFSKRALVDLLRNLLKVAFIGNVGLRVVREALEVGPGLVHASVLESASVAGRLVGRLALNVGVSFLVVAAFDYIYQRWEHTQSIRMTRREVEDELKESEGDPQLRSQLRQRQRQLALGRMLQDVKRADVVVANPTHLAVALRYDQRKMVAPVVVAKGAGLLAQRIRDLAKEHRVPVVENVALARGLYYNTDVGGAIPADLYQAVAEVLAYVYQLRRQR